MSDEPTLRAPRNVLFVCSRNPWRSLTAEQVWRRHPALRVRSAGTSPNARRTVTAEDLPSADVIVVKEEKPRSRLLADFRRPLEGKPLHVLDVPDRYRSMDSELVAELRVSVAALPGLDGNFPGE